MTSATSWREAPLRQSRSRQNRILFSPRTTSITRRMGCGSKRGEAMTQKALDESV